MVGARLRQVIALVCCVVLVGAAGTRIAPINTGRQELNIYGHESPMENAPPEYAFAIQAFGAFRGLITDIAFIRLEKLKEEGKFYDAMQLGKWICTLQPHFPTVWEFMAWNMSWNISVTTFTPEERWKWVYNGVKLLRDQGIQFNPRALNLYKQLSWTFNNKMGDTLDDEHYAYKAYWAWRMHLVLGEPPDPMADLNTAQIADEMKSFEDVDLLEEAGRATFQQTQEKLRRQAELLGEAFVEREAPDVAGGVTPGWTPFEMAQAAELVRLLPLTKVPETLDELYVQYPQAREMVRALRTMRDDAGRDIGVPISDDELTEEEYWRDTGLAFRFFDPYRRLLEPQTLQRSVRGADDESDTRPAAVRRLDALLGVSEENVAGQALVHFLQAKVLRDVYKLDPEFMVELVQTFGPMDWRSVDAQALYWAARGLVLGGTQLHDFKNDKTNTARILLFSLRNLFQRGDVTFEPNREQVHLSYLSLGRDLNMIEPMHRAYMEYAPLFDPNPGEQGGAGETYRVGHINFLSEAIRLLYLAGREREATRYYQILRETYPLTRGGQPNETFQKPLHDFVVDSFLESVEVPGMRDIRLVLDGLLYNAYTELAKGNVTRYARVARTAQQYHTRYMQKKGNLPTGRLDIPPFREVTVDAFGRWLAQGPPMAPADTLHKVRLWRRAPLYLRQVVYDDLLPMFERECELWEFELEQAFPEPPGMEEYREAHPERRRDPAADEAGRDEDVRTLPRGPGG